MSGRTVEVGGFVFCHRNGHPEEIKVFQVVEGDRCTGCAFSRVFGRCKKPKGLFGECTAEKRTDGKSVIFEKINVVKMIKPRV